MAVFKFKEFVAVFSGMSGAGGGEGEKRQRGEHPWTWLTSIFTWWAKEPEVSSFAHALGSAAHSRRISPEVEWIVLVAGHVEPVAAIAGGNW